MNKARTSALIAGIIFFVLGFVLQGIIPAILPESESIMVTRTVKTKEGIEIREAAVAPRPIALERQGRRIYLREGCWYCHSLYVRPVYGEEARWGPIAEAGDYSYDTPHLLGTRRIGPDLTRAGGKYGDDWHVAHYYAPRDVVPDSIMPAYPWVVDRAALKSGKSGAQLLSHDGKALVAYVQSLGAGHGKWRDTFLREQALHAGRIAEGPEARGRGRRVYARRCAGCHGASGDGQGPAARLMQTKPRDFIRGTYKFKSTGPGAPPTDADLYRTLTYGLRGTSMPSWKDLSERERSDVIVYIKSFSPKMFDTRPRVLVSSERLLVSDPGPSMAVVRAGKQVYAAAGCASCHGAAGRGDGPAASALKDVWGNPVRPADFTTGVFKSGPAVSDVMRTVTAGVDGTPMPSWDALLSEEERWAVSYYVWSLSSDNLDTMRKDVRASLGRNLGLWCRLVTAWTGQPPLDQPRRFK